MGTFRSGLGLINCMGGMRAYQACDNVPNFVQNFQMTVANANVYVAITAGLAYQCGPGYGSNSNLHIIKITTRKIFVSVYLNNFACFMSTSVNQNATLQVCLNTWINLLNVKQCKH